MKIIVRRVRVESWKIQIEIEHDWGSEEGQRALRILRMYLRSGYTIDDGVIEFHHGSSERVNPLYVRELNTLERCQDTMHTHANRRIAVGYEPLRVWAQRNVPTLREYAERLGDKIGERETLMEASAKGIAFGFLLPVRLSMPVLARDKERTQQALLQISDGSYVEVMDYGSDPWMFQLYGSFSGAPDIWAEAEDWRTIIRKAIV